MQRLLFHVIDLNKDDSADVNENHRHKQQMMMVMMWHMRGTQSSATSKCQRSSSKTLQPRSHERGNSFSVFRRTWPPVAYKSQAEVAKENIDTGDYRLQIEESGNANCLCTEIHPARCERVTVCADRAVSMTHPLNYFHSWAVNGGFGLAPFSLQLWATVSLFYSPWPEPDSSHVVQ